MKSYTKTGQLPFLRVAAAYIAIHSKHISIPEKWWQRALVFTKTKTGRQMLRTKNCGVKTNLRIILVERIVDTAIPDTF